MSEIKDLKTLSPREIVGELDHFIIGQKEAKRAVSIAMRNRWRRQQVEEPLRDEIYPKNIIMIGPTGVGKTEIARRLAKLAAAPFVKVEATKYTEVGYVGKDVESMIRELTDTGVNMVKEEEEEKVQAKAAELAEERLLDLLIAKPVKPVSKAKKKEMLDNLVMGLGATPLVVENQANGTEEITLTPEQEAKEKEEEAKKEQTYKESREKMRVMLKEGKMDHRFVDLDIAPPSRGGGFPMIEVVSTGGSFDEISKSMKEMLSNMMPRSSKKKKTPIPEALKLLKHEEAQKLIDMDEVYKKAIRRVEQTGIVFFDEIDKIATGGKGHGPDVSREGVQRDILPIVEGCRVQTRYGMVNTEHVLFIAAGAFHVNKPSDLMPELQGRFPIRVELQSLLEEDFLRILTEPQNALVKQYVALMQTEGVELEYAESGLKEIARYAALANQKMENIGARRLHTIMEKVLDELSFDASEKKGQKIVIDAEFVKKYLEKIIKDDDLSRYIL